MHARNSLPLEAVDPSATMQTARHMAHRRQAKSGTKRTRSRSELGDTKSSGCANPGLVDLMTQRCGLPMPTLGSPRNELPHAKPFGPPGDNGDEEVDEGEGEEEPMDDRGVSMDLKFRADDINPSFEGFKSNRVTI